MGASEGMKSVVKIARLLGDEAELYVESRYSLRRVLMFSHSCQSCALIPISDGIKLSETSHEWVKQRME